ncbi:hypothetical protein E3E36_10260 [Thermococcus sp. M36]|uniref:hypothetical protein n=1 Tax=Thermococcus sp. M36 TaxID=1638261 RepID=UPI00143AB747|nr:hypothetical protein [Thermococcus sp. M36]NJE06514.1 hypothetical protein [Thermococcus sp. M36]
MRGQRVLLILTLSLIISSSVIGWAVVSISMNEMRKAGTSDFASTYRSLHLGLLIPSAIFFCLGYLLGRLLGKDSFVGIGLPVWVLSFFLTLPLSTPLDAILTPWEVSPEGVCQRAPYLPEEYLLPIALTAGASMMLIIGWAMAVTGGNTGGGSE